MRTDNPYVFPYLLHKIAADEPNKVWATDITYLKVGTTTVYLTAYIDLFSRYIVGWGLFTTLEAENSLEVLWRAVALYGKPQVINTDQGSQYVCRAWVNYLKEQGVAISMNRKATPTQNIYIERFWRTLKYARFIRRPFSSFDELERAIGWFVDYYNHERRHTSLKNNTPAAVYGIRVGNFVGSGYFYRNFDASHEQTLRKDSEEDLLQEVCRCYVRHNFRPEYRAGVICLHFGLNESVCQLVKIIECPTPLSAAEVEQEYQTLQQMGKQVGCSQFRLISLGGYGAKIKNPAPLNLSLSDTNYLESLRSLYHIELFAANETTYRAMSRKLSPSNRVAVIQATGTGKSLLIARFALDCADKQVVVVTPSVLIIRQIKKHLSHRNDARLHFVTYASLTRRMFESVGAIVLDEFHRCGAAQWSQGVARLLAQNPSAKIVGTSATPIRHSDRRRNMADELFEGQVVSNLTLAKAMAHQILPVPHYVSALYSIDEVCPEAPELLRIEWKRTSGVPTLLQKHLNDQARKIVVFCKNIDHLQQIKPLMSEWFSFLGKPINLYELHNRAQARSVFRAYELHKADQVDVLLCINMLNEGVHTHGVDAVVMLRDTSSPTIYQQQLGRCMSVSHDTTPVVFDLVNNFKHVRVTELVRQYEHECRFLARKNPEIEHQQFVVYDQVESLRNLYKALSNPIEVWDTHYDELVAFYHTHGHTQVPPKMSKLYGWCARQRKDRKMGLLSKQRIKRLDRIGFLWDRLAQSWMEQYKRLLRFVAEHNSAHVSRNDDLLLHYWCKNQRQLYAKGRMDELRKALLDRIGFSWNALDWFWEQQFEALREYKTQKGHCNVPPTQNRVLASWVTTQRLVFKAGTMPIERQVRLETIGFEWYPLDNIWNARFEQMRNYLQQTGRTKPPIDQKQLYTWYKRQKLLAQRGKLTLEQLRKLASLGWGFGATAANAVKCGTKGEIEP